jgi:hypothetical protein
MVFDENKRRDDEHEVESLFERMKRVVDNHRSNATESRDERIRQLADEVRLRHR